MSLNVSSATLLDGNRPSLVTATAFRRAVRRPLAADRPSDRAGLTPLLDETPQLLAPVQPALGVDIAQVVLHGLTADEQLRGDLGVGQALADQMGHLGLPAGQREHRLFLGPLRRTLDAVQPALGQL